MKNRILIGLAIALFVLVLPVGMLSSGSVGPDDVFDDSAVVDKAIESEGDVHIEKVSPGEMAPLLEGIELPKMEGKLAVVNEPWNAPFITDEELSLIDSAKQKGYSMARPGLGEKKSLDIPSTQAMNAADEPTRGSEPTRGTDNEPNNDPWNGSKLASSDSLTGSLTWFESDPGGTRGDYIDWYKMEHKGVDPRVPGSLKNITLEFTEFDSEDITLYELTYTDTEFTTDYLDFISVAIFYTDPFWGFSELGGKKIWYDNGDDTDGWVYDGGHSDPDFQDNWTLNYRTPGESKGVEDTNGGIGGLTESGWYYIMVMFNYYVTPEAVDRPDFVIDYSFTVTTTNDVNNFPSSTGNTAGAPNDFNNATLTKPTMPGRTHSALNHFDWYRFEGNGPENIWNMSIWVNVSRTGWGINDDFGVTINDNWMWIYMLWWGEGEDGEFGTEDDIWTVNLKVLYYAVSFVDGSGNPVSWMQERFTSTGGNNMKVNLWNVNDRFDAPTDGHPYLSGKNPRTMFVGLYSEPAKFGQTAGGGLAQLYSDYQTFDQYDISFNVHEVPPNNPPSIDKIEVFTKNPANVNLFSNVGGYYGTDFTVEVTYSDEDNNPPENVWLLIDPLTAFEKKIDIVNSPKNPFATNFAEGVVYKYDVSGDLLKEGNHVILAYAKDKIPTGSIKTAYQSLNFWLNDTLIVWDDDPVMKNQNFVGAPTILEDSLPVGIPLETVNGVFIDPEGVFEGFAIWNETLGDWTDTLDLEEMTLKIEEFSGYGSVVVYPKENRHGSATIKVMGYDKYSFQNHSFKITITEVNDPPMVNYIMIGDEEYEVDNTNPLNPFAVLDSVEVLEDEEFQFQIIAEDTDHEPDRTPLRYEYIRSFSGDWDEDPTVGFDSGIVTFTPTNADSQKGLLAMVFNVRDGRDNGEIRLTVSFKVTNVNDPPTITLPPSISPFYLQDQRVQFRVTGSDIDKGDVLAFSVNIESSVGDAEPVLDQLHPDADIKEGRDWGMDANTGDFWFIASDQNIWKNEDGTMAKTKEIEFEFAVTDKAGAKATAKRTLIFNDVNSPPEAPKEIYHQIKDEDPDTPGDQGLTVMFWVDPVFDIELDTIQYRWTFSDGGSSTGIRINYTFATEGQKTVQIYAFDGTDESESISKVITVTKPVVDPKDKDPVDPMDPGTGTDNNSMLIIIIIVVVVLFLLIIAVLLFFVLRKKPAPPAQIYGYDQQQLAAYQMQGLPPAQPGALPPGENPELPPAPMDGDQQMLYPEGQLQPEFAAPQAQTEMAQPEQPQGMLCPSCSSPVDPTWFLCPNCKAPLQ